MRNRLGSTVILLGASVLQAAPAPADKDAQVRPLAFQDARTYAEQLAGIVDQVADSYVRPVSRSQLVFAALSGLYEAAGVPAPAGLQERLGKLVKDPAGPEGAQEKPDPQDGDAIIYIARLRQQLGDPEELRGSAGLRASIQALTRSLDPYSKIVSGAELRRGHGEDTQRGIGLALATDDLAGPLRIKTVFPGSPAQRAGLRPGDRITHLEGKAVGGPNQPLLLVKRAIEGDDNTDARKVTLTVLPGNGKVAREVKLVQQDYQLETVFGVHRNPDESWNHLLDVQQKIGYIRVGALENGTAEQLHRALLTLKSHEMRGLIFDLRWSPGGFLNEAVLITRMFLNEGTIATIKSRARQDEQVFRVQSPTPFGDFPLLVLTNRETTGGSELIAAALQDNQRALVAGQRTFGKGSVQTMLALPIENAGLKLTTGSFIRPSGKALHRFPDSKPTDDWGVRPQASLEMPLSADLNQQLREWWEAQSLRPSRSNELLPLDDPENDPPRQAALQALRKLIK